MLVLTLPLVFNIHTQLRRLSGSPRLPWGTKVKPCPRLDGLHLYFFILNRFLISAFSGLNGDIISICFVAFFCDIFMAFLIWRSPSVSNIESLNYWYRSWTVPGSFISTLGFIFWTIFVYNNSENANADLLHWVSFLIQVITVVALLIVFISNFISFKYKNREIFPTFLLAAINYDLDSKLIILSKNRYSLSRQQRDKKSLTVASASPLVQSPNKNDAVGAAVQSSVKANTKTANEEVEKEEFFSPVAAAEGDEVRPNSRRTIKDDDAASPTPSHRGADASPEPKHDKQGTEQNDEDDGDDESSDSDTSENDQIKYERTAGQRVLKDEGRSLALCKKAIQEDAIEDHFSNISSEISFG